MAIRIFIAFLAFSGGCLRPFVARSSGSRRSAGEVASRDSRGAAIEHFLICRITRMLPGGRG